MKIPSSILTATAFMTASAVSAQQEPLEAKPAEVAAVVVESTSADPVGFIKAGQGRLMPLTSSEFEGIEREGFKAESLSWDEVQSVVGAHNCYRSLHDAPPVTWNWDVANYGDNWIQACEFRHSGGPYGENIAYGYQGFPTAIKA
ncbi:hypothetical protein BGX29_002002 [Mortierella sp. GBA35]|nr:hypothetical protein BGX29_002002 [Mortierella sp. GBA35]